MRDLVLRFGDNIAYNITFHALYANLQAHFACHVCELLEREGLGGTMLTFE